MSSFSFAGGVGAQGAATFTGDLIGQQSANINLQSVTADTVTTNELTVNGAALVTGNLNCTGTATFTDLGVDSLEITNDINVNRVKTVALKTWSLVRGSSDYEYASSLTLTTDALTRGHIIRQDVAGTVVDTLPTGSDFHVWAALNDMITGDTVDSTIEVRTAGSSCTYSLLGNTAMTISQGPSTYSLAANDRKTLRLHFTLGVSPNVTCQIYAPLDSQNVEVEGIVYAEAGLISDDSLYVTGASTLNGATTINGVTTINNYLSCVPTDPGASGIALLPAAALYANTALYINTVRAADAAFNLIDARAASAPLFTVTGQGNTTVGGTLAVAGASTVNGLTNTGNSSTSGNSTVTGTLSVSNNALLRGTTFFKWTVSSALSSNTDLTFTAADVVNGFIRRDLSGANANRNDYFPTAASLVSTYGLAVGDSFQTIMEVATASSGGWTYNVYAGTGGTLVGFSSVATNTKTFIQWRAIMTNVSSGTEAYYLIRPSIYQNGFTTFV
jgi:hypothetical protein